MTIKENGMISGLLEVSLDVHADDRGSFTEIFQAEKLKAAGLPDWFLPVQTNVSANKDRGVIRGIHAEPWNKYITPIAGEVFVAIVDLRADNFGITQTFRLKYGDGLFVPKGCGNSYQTLTSDVLYLYHVDAHWSSDLKYLSIDIFDETLAIQWPISRNEAIISEKDLANPALNQLEPVK